MNRDRKPSPSSSDIRLKFSLIVLGFSLLMTLSVGFSLRHWIYSSPLSEIVSAQLEENKKFPMAVEGVRFRFRQGWLPALAIYADSFAAKDSSCPSRRILAKNVFVSLNLSKLFEGKILPKKVLISSLLATVPKVCDGSVSVQNEPSNGEPQITITKKKSSAKKILSKKASAQRVADNLFSDYKKVFNSFQIPLINIKEFQIFLIDSGETKLRIKGRLKFRTRGDQVTANIYPNQIWFKEILLPVNQGLLSLSLSEEKIQINFDTLIREGRLNVSGSFLNDENNTSELSVDLIKVPISAITNLFLEKTQFQYLWANCKFAVTGSFAKITDAEFPLEKCELTGPYGSARVQSSKMTLARPKLLAVEFTKMDFDEIFKSKRNLYLSGIFSSFGVLSGVMVLDEKKNWNLKGHLLNSKLLFSRNNFRELQKVNRLPFQVDGSEKKIEITLKDVEIEGGEIVGQVGMVFSEDKKDGDIRLALSKVALKPKIYRLMLDAEQTEFSTFGKIKIRDRKITEWSGVLASQQISAKEFSLQGAKIEASQVPEGAPSFRVSAQTGSWAPKSSFIKLVGPTTLEHTWSPEALRFKEFSAKLSLPEKSHWVWRRAYARLENGWQVSSEGELRNKSALKAWLQWDIPDEPFLRWQYGGTWKKGKWSPQQPWMRTWLKSNPQFVSENPRIEFVDLETKSSDDVSLLLLKGGESE